jgi:hypothetical protein
MKKIPVTLLILLVIFFAVAVFADDNLSKATDIVRRSSEMFERASKSIKPEKLASNVREHVSTSYGFTAGSSEVQNTFFALGVAIADAEAALRSGSTEKSLIAINSLERLIRQFKAPQSFIESSKALRNAIDQGVSTIAVNKAGLQALRPFLEEEAEKNRMTNYLRLGEWAEAAKLVLMIARAEENNALARDFIKEFNYAGHFLSEKDMEHLPPLVINALKEIKDIGEGKDMGDKALRKGLKALDDIIELMG